jgi:hypothetical protein
VISLIVAPIAASFLVPWRELLRSSLFVVLSVLSAVVPTAVSAIFSAEFPVLIGELIARQQAEDLVGAVALGYRSRCCVGLRVAAAVAMYHWAVLPIAPWP